MPIGDNRYIARSFTYWLCPITSFHHIYNIGYPRYYRDILESVPFLICHMFYVVTHYFLTRVQNHSDILNT